MHNGNITIKHGHRHVLVIKVEEGKKEKNGLKVPPFLSKHCLKLQANALLQMLE